MMHPPQHLYGILGFPLGHSMSPALHTWGFKQSGHPGAFFRWEKKQEELPDFFTAVRSLPISGLCVTIPHKEHVLPFLDSLTERAKSVGAVNTVINTNGHLTGDNTDVTGFLNPLRNREKAISSAFVLGAGGACRAVLTGLREAGVTRILLSARRTEQTERLAAEFSCESIPWEQREQTMLDALPALIVNTTPMGMRGDNVHTSPLHEETLLQLARIATGAELSSCHEATDSQDKSTSETHGAPSASPCFDAKEKSPAPQQARGEKRKSGPLPIVYDIVYNPSQTRLLRSAHSAGLPVIDGVSFFAAQGLEQFRLWTGIPLPFQEARQLIQTELDKNA